MHFACCRDPSIHAVIDRNALTSRMMIMPDAKNLGTVNNGFGQICTVSPIEPFVIVMHYRYTKISIISFLQPREFVRWEKVKLFIIRNKRGKWRRINEIELNFVCSEGVYFVCKYSINNSLPLTI